ncbi:MAG TPA: ATP-grasp fold amidoligase family protein [Candidatus Binatia bacterium]|nr:ATP-grasp fold amidoligase family protein [Candidatus Binatia bacterium]
MADVLETVSRLLTDRAYVRLLYLKSHGRLLRLRQPRTFNEKLQWYKLYYRDPLMTTMSDKYEVRKYLEARGHGGLLNELYGVYDTVEAIDLSRLPGRFILKATHGSNMNIICRDKETLDWPECRRTLRRWLRSNYFYSGRQWAYKDIQPRLICEKYLQNDEFDQLIDYKFYCFNGRPQVLWICTGRYGPGGVKYNAYDMDGKRLHVFKGKPGSDLPIGLPDNFVAMAATAAALCGAFPFVRVDLYSIGGKLIFSEFTFYPDSGVVAFSPERYNRIYGDLFVLPGIGPGPGK